MDSHIDLPGSEGKNHRIHVLLVEKSYDLASRSIRYLERSGMQITHYFSTGGVIGHLHARKPVADLVIMDLGNGDHTEGIKAAFEIRKTHTVPLLFLTASSEESKAGESSGLSSCSFFSREITLSQLDALIRAVVECTEIRENLE